MLSAAENEAVVLRVLAERYGLPPELPDPGTVTVVEAPHPRLILRALERAGGAVVGVAPEWAHLARGRFKDPALLAGDLRAAAGELGGHLFCGVARTGVDVPEPAEPVTVIDASDPRLPSWVLGHFVGEAWVVLDGNGSVLSTAVLKRYDPRLREISVGTVPRARGRGLARSVVAAAARAVLAEGRAVLYNHAVDNAASARVAAAVGLHELVRYYGVVRKPRDGVEFGQDVPDEPRA